MQIQGEMSVNKLIVLFVFDKMESALSERTVVEMCTSNGFDTVSCPAVAMAVIIPLVKLLGGF